MKKVNKSFYKIDRALQNALFTFFKFHQKYPRSMWNKIWNELCLRANRESNELWAQLISLYKIGREAKNSKARFESAGMLILLCIDVSRLITIVLALYFKRFSLYAWIQLRLCNKKNHRADIKEKEQDVKYTKKEKKKENKIW